MLCFQLAALKYIHEFQYNPIEAHRIHIVPFHAIFHVPHHLEVGEQMINQGTA